MQKETVKDWLVDCKEVCHFIYMVFASLTISTSEMGPMLRTIMSTSMVAGGPAKKGTNINTLYQLILLKYVKLKVKSNIVSYIVIYYESTKT